MSGILSVRRNFAIKRSDEDNKEHPTIAGLLMFGQENAIMEEFPEYFLDYREKYDETNRWTDRVSSNTIIILFIIWF